jgi:hypothetical protein
VQGAPFSTFQASGGGLSKRDANQEKPLNKAFDGFSTVWGDSVVKTLTHRSQISSRGLLLEEIDEVLPAFFVQMDSA